MCSSNDSSRESVVGSGTFCFCSLHTFTYLPLSTVAKLGMCLAWHVQPETEGESKPRGKWKARESRSGFVLHKNRCSSCSTKNISKTGGLIPVDLLSLTLYALERLFAAAVVPLW